MNTRSFISPMSTLPILAEQQSACAASLEISRNAEIAREMVERSKRQDAQHGIRSGERRGCRADRPVTAANDQQRVAALGNRAASHRAVAATETSSTSTSSPTDLSALRGRVGRLGIGRDSAAAAIEEDWDVGHAKR